MPALHVALLLFLSLLLCGTLCVARGLLLQDTYDIPASRVVLYGQSVGSGPSCWLAAQRPDLAGVVLHSPLLSGVRVLKPHVRWWPAWADVYPNHTLAPRIKAPVLVMHVREGGRDGGRKGRAGAGWGGAAWLGTQAWSMG